MGTLHSHCKRAAGSTAWPCGDLVESKAESLRGDSKRHCLNDAGT